MEIKRLSLAFVFAIILATIVFMFEYYDGIFSIKGIYFSLLSLHILLGNFIGRLSIYLSDLCLSKYDK